FPFGGPPFAPFLAWARESGVLSQAPIGPLVHPETGLWTSFRGALLFAEAVTGVPTAPAPPCATCAAEPCRSACPVDAFAGGQYDVPRCRAFLRTPEGADCMTRGCAARRACPVGQGFAPDSERAMLHMRAFRGA
ncbi:MAG: ferredoxin, partial [Pseudomonadota bacterium]